MQSWWNDSSVIAVSQSSHGVKQASNDAYSGHVFALQLRDGIPLNIGALISSAHQIDVQNVEVGNQD